MLTAAVAARDMNALTGLMSDDVHVSFGGRYGKDQFVAFWGQTPTEQAKLWREMNRILALGCAARRDGKEVEYRALPAMFVTSGALDGFTTWVALPGALLRARPSATAKAAMRVPAWTVLDAIDHDGGNWVEVRTPKGRRGFVAIGEVRSVIDYRLILGERAGQWRITGFLAGD